MHRSSDSPYSATAWGTRPGFRCRLVVQQMATESKSISLQKQRQQVEALGLDEKQRSKFLIDEWRRMKKTEKKIRKAEERERLCKAEAEEKKRIRRTEAEERRVEMELEKLRIEMEAIGLRRRHVWRGRKTKGIGRQVPEPQSYLHLWIGRITWIATCCVSRGMQLLQGGKRSLC